MSVLSLAAGDVPGDRAAGRRPGAAGPARRPAAAGGTGSCGIPAGSGRAALIQTGAAEGRPGELPAAAGPTGRRQKLRPRAGTSDLRGHAPTETGE